MRTRRILVTLAAAATTFTMAAPTASAADTTPEEPVTPVIAEYNGKQINLAEDWEGAQICTELAGGNVRCYDDEAAAQEDVAPAPAALKRANPDKGLPGKCAPDYWCLFEHANYKGRKLQFHDTGTRKLANWGFRDKTSSIYRFAWRYGMKGATMIDYRSGVLHDRTRRLGSTSEAAYPNLKNLAYPGGGNWNDKVDAFKID
ncbi:peptidase inhibitor family I36 protein [Streptomyces sp. NPDC059009]|uniref:peptidase inhibitor family I36 protein n=1 Tax=Streptomyces sp. NPDC059009 TaxID=3346694 RepID=UPI0036A40462